MVITTAAKTRIQTTISTGMIFVDAVVFNPPPPPFRRRFQVDVVVVVVDFVVVLGVVAAVTRRNMMKRQRTNDNLSNQLKRKERKYVTDEAKKSQATTRCHGHNRATKKSYVTVTTDVVQLNFNLNTPVVLQSYPSWFRARAHHRVRFFRRHFRHFPNLRSHFLHVPNPPTPFSAFSQSPKPLLAYSESSGATRAV